MSVFFVTQQGRTLYRDDLTAEDITRAVGALIEVTGYEFNDPKRIELHASTRHIVEWWDPDSARYQIEPLL